MLRNRVVLRSRIVLWNRVALRSRIVLRNRVVLRSGIVLKSKIVLRSRVVLHRKFDWNVCLHSLVPCLFGPPTIVYLRAIGVWREIYARRLGMATDLEFGD